MCPYVCVRLSFLHRPQLGPVLRAMQGLGRCLEGVSRAFVAESYGSSVLRFINFQPLKDLEREDFQ